MELTSFKLYSLNCTVAYCVCTDPTLLATLQLQSGHATDVSKHLLRVCSKAIPIQSYVAPAPNHMHVYAGPGRRLISVDLDKVLIEWYKEQIAQQRHVFNRHIKTKALEVAQQLGLRESFKASDMWVVGWKKRHKAELGLDKSEGDSLTSTPQSQKTHNVSISAPGDYEEQLREEAISELLRLGSSDDVDETGGQLEDSSGDMEHIQVRK